MEDIQKQLDNLNDRIASLEINPILKDHRHNRFDSYPVDFSDIDNKKLYVHHTIYGADAATGANYGVFYIVPVACVITAFQEVHQTAGSDGGAVTLQLEKLSGTTAPDSGDVVLSTALSLKATANTVQNGVLTLTLAYRSLKAGDRLCLKDVGTLTSVSNVTVKVELLVL